MVVWLKAHWFVWLLNQTARERKMRLFVCFMKCSKRPSKTLHPSVLTISFGAQFCFVLKCWLTDGWKLNCHTHTIKQMNSCFHILKRASALIFCFSFKLQIAISFDQTFLRSFIKHYYTISASSLDAFRRLVRSNFSLSTANKSPLYSRILLWFLFADRLLDYLLNSWPDSFFRISSSSSCSFNSFYFFLLFFIRLFISAVELCEWWLPNASFLLCCWFFKVHVRMWPRP